MIKLKWKRKNKIDEIFKEIKRKGSEVIRKNYILESAVNNGLNYVYVVDVETNTIIYANHVLNSLYGAELKGRICHETIAGYFHECNMCADRDDDSALTRTFYSDRFKKLFFVTRKFITYNGRKIRIEKATDITSSISYIKKL